MSAPTPLVRKLVYDRDHNRITSVHFRRDTAEWSTPQELFDELNSEFGFTVDVASTHNNAKCEKHYTIYDDGLSQSWDGEVVWCNPPYGSQIRHWVLKAFTSKAITVMLIPSRTDTSWFHDYCYGKAEIRFIRGRIKFSGHENNAPFPSMLVIFREEGFHGAN